MKKPSSIKQLRGKYTKIDIPFFGATNLFGTVYSHDKKLIEKLNSDQQPKDNGINHEMIHVKQAVCTCNSWFLFYSLYIIEWLSNLPLIFTGIYNPYKFMSTELEAVAHQFDYTYCDADKACQWKDFSKIPLKERYSLAKQWNAEKKNGGIWPRFVREEVVPVMEKYAKQS